MAVTKRLRYEILRRDNHACRYCGATAPDVKLVVDHVTPVALGGGDEPTNLVTACADCNSGKSASTPDSELVSDVATQALVWAKALELAAEQRATDARQRKLRNDRFRDEWESLRPHLFRSADLAPDWEQSLEQFSRAGLSDRDIIEMVAVTMNARASDKWRYFCGCCWNVVRDLQDSARALIEATQEGE
ncbi:HNH endonuclease [Rhodococcus zopfii]